MDWVGVDRYGDAMTADAIEPPYSLDNALRWAETMMRPGSAASVLAAEVRRLRSEQDEKYNTLAWRANEVASFLNEVLHSDGSFDPELAWQVDAMEAWQNLVGALGGKRQMPDPIVLPMDMSDAAFDQLVQDVIAEHDARPGDVDDAHYELVMPFVVVASNGGPFDDAAYAAGWEAGVIDVKLMALTGLGQSATDLLCREENWPQVSLLLMKHGWSVDEGSMSVADGWVSVKVVGF